MLPEPLLRQIRHVRRRARGVLWGTGVSWLIVAVAGGLALAGSVDWLLHVDDGAIRLLLGLTILGVAGTVAWQFLWVPLTHQLSDLDIAIEIERRMPALHDSLASSVEFADDDFDARIGSPELQRSVVAGTLRRMEDFQPADIVETRGLSRAIVAAGGVLLTAMVLIALSPASVGVALTRLALPFSSVAWPRQTQLQLVDANLQPIPVGAWRVAEGQPLGLFVADGEGALPDNAEMEYQLATGETVREELRPIRLPQPDGTSRDVFSPGTALAAGNVRFRAVGGDDETMPFHIADVLPAPRLAEVTVRVLPPEYTGMAENTLPPGVPRGEVLVGSQVHLIAKASKPLSQVFATLTGRERWPVAIDAEGDRFKSGFLVEADGPLRFRFEIIDRDGFAVTPPPAYEMKAIADLEPEVSIDDPPRDLQMTAAGELLIKVVARDDLAVDRVRLSYHLTSASGTSEGVIPLFDGTGHPARVDAKYLWQLEELNLDPGSQIVFHAEATDLYDLGPRHLGRSRTATLTIVSPEEKQDELAARQRELLKDLENVRSTQVDARARVHELQLQVEKAGALRESDVDLLKRTELEQRQISARLTHPADGAAARTRDILDEAARNRVLDDDLKRRLENVLTELDQLRTERLPAADRALTLARKLGQTSAGRPDSGAKSPPQGPAGQTPEGKVGDEQSSPSTSDRSGSNSEENAGTNRPSPESKSEHPGDGEASPPRSNTAEPAGDDNTAKRAETAGASDALHQAEESQGAIVESLEELLAGLSRWRDHLAVDDKLKRAIAAEQSLADETAKLAQETLSKSLSQLSPQQQADVARLAERQSQNANAVEELEQQLDEAAQSQSPSPGAGSTPFQDGLAHLREQGVTNRMRDAAGEIGENQLGRAIENQSQSLDQLEQLQRILSDQPESDVAALVKRLKESEQQLAELRKRQTELHKQTAQSGAADAAARSEELKQLRKQQAELRKAAENLARELRRLQARNSAEAAARAADSMQQAEDSLEQGAAEESLSHEAESLDSLSEAARELAKARREAEEQLAQELLEKVVDQLAAMSKRQQGLIDETDRLETERASRGNWSRGQLKSLSQLVEAQRELRVESDEIANDLAAAEVFALAVRGASRLMEQAANRLEHRDAGADTITLEVAAKQRFDDLVASLKADKSSANQPSQEGPNEEEADSQPQPDGIPPLAQLKMLRTLQQDLLKRTTEFDARRPAGGELSDDQKLELESLGAEQGELAELIERLLNEAADAADTEADPMPESQPEGK